jgi:hypothetical protein
MDVVEVPRFGNGIIVRAIRQLAPYFRRRSTHLVQLAHVSRSGVVLATSRRTHSLNLRNNLVFEAAQK